MRHLFSAAAVLMTAGFAAAAFAAPASSGGVPDKNGIIWDDPKAPPKSPESSETFRAQPAPAAKPAPAPAGNLDNAGIVWNAPAKAPDGANLSARSGANLSARSGANPSPRSGANPTSPRSTNTVAVSTAGPCHEFQTTIVIDGRPQPAHGTVCQQPDGSWHVVDK